jgi:hypothetical protein
MTKSSNPFRFSDALKNIVNKKYLSDFEIKAIELLINYRGDWHYFMVLDMLFENINTQIGITETKYVLESLIKKGILHKTNDYLYLQHKTLASVTFWKKAASCTCNAQLFVDMIFMYFKTQKENESSD